MSDLQILTSDANSVTFAHPDDPDYQVRFKYSSSRKNVDGVRLNNHITEIIINDDNAVTIAGQPVREALSVRIRVSGSPENASRLKAMIDKASAELPVWATENVFIGFRPITPPTQIV